MQKPTTLKSKKLLKLTQLQLNSDPKRKTVEWRRLKSLKGFEEEAYQNGFQRVAGVDEAGRGPLAGPVVAAACFIPVDLFISGVNDSKQLNAAERDVIFDFLVTHPRIQFAVGIVDCLEIDQINIYQASLKAMLLAVNQLADQPDHLLVDGVKLPHPHISCQKIIKGDAKSFPIAAASIIAKVTRDRIMQQYHQQWPQYGFEQHKGYGTPFHLSAIQASGPCPIHRLSFSPFAPKK